MSGRRLSERVTMRPLEDRPALVYAAMYKVQDTAATTAEVFNEAKLRWVADVVALDCRPTHGAEPVIDLTEVEGLPWVQITANVRRTPESTWPLEKTLRSAPPKQPRPPNPAALLARTHRKEN